jgi:hypothetical protein
MKRSKPFIRRESVWSKIQSWPFDTLLWVNEVVSSTPWDDYAESVAVPAGYGLTIVYTVLVRALAYYSTSDRRSANPLFQANHYDYERLRARATHTLLLGDEAGNSSSLALSHYLGFVVYGFRLLTLAIYVLAAVNTGYLLASHRNYTLFYSLIDTQPKSSSARKVTLSNDGPTSTWDRILHMLYKRTASLRRSQIDAATSDTLTYTDSDYDDTTLDEINLIEKEMWELSVWVPSKFRLALASTLSPVLLAILYTLTELPYWKVLVVALGFSASLQYLSTKFAVLVQDKQVLYQEMFEEYNSKFVKPKTNILKKDVVIDATFGPEAPSVLTVKTDVRAHLMTGKLKVFITHDIDGRAYNNLSIAHRRKTDFNGGAKTITSALGAADTSVHPLANSSYISNASYNRSLASGVPPRQRAGQLPLESPFKSPDKRNSYPYFQQSSTPYSRPSTAHKPGGRQAYDPKHAYDRSFQSPKPSSSPSRARAESRAREFQSPRPVARRLLKTPLPPRHSLPAAMSRSPSPSKRPWA